MDVDDDDGGDDGGDDDDGDVDPGDEVFSSIHFPLLTLNWPPLMGLKTYSALPLRCRNNRFKPHCMEMSHIWMLLLSLLIHEKSGDCMRSARCRSWGCGKLCEVFTLP